MMRVHPGLIDERSEAVAPPRLARSSSVRVATALRHSTRTILAFLSFLVVAASGHAQTTYRVGTPGTGDPKEVKPVAPSGTTSVRVAQDAGSIDPIVVTVKYTDGTYSHSYTVIQGQIQVITAPAGKEIVWVRIEIAYPASPPQWAQGTYTFS